MLTRQEYQQSIISSLAWLSKEVELSNKINFTDVNVYSENFYRDLLNLALGYQLTNINIQEPNAAAIDLGDEKYKNILMLYFSSIYRYKSY
ncbi:MAG TPA: SMEK domain-containing protein [Gammaproteobacteria bacterium]|nr:SMEK domain-containing protein [Xanthomonadales bacterium]MCB1595996.1 SMEK domain-containing protein [Xanthomonadales bacterium]HPI95841.1 SMEK domain-containing protein [Gammaproteobacteria bacterium]HPQ87083.1 SMEK domain-containing protein [Gammaproteobacteria bacterium]